MALLYEQTCGMTAYNGEDQDFNQFVSTVYKDGAGDYVSYFQEMINTADPFGTLVLERLQNEKSEHDRMQENNTLIEDSASSNLNSWMNLYDRILFRKPFRYLQDRC
ncbi:unnamed protein product [Rotaria sp. Silwood1]|nr:unnamed protein product [Rotaria sp. Silwood1]